MKKVILGSLCIFGSMQGMANSLSPLLHELHGQLKQIHAALDKKAPNMSVIPKTAVSSAPETSGLPSMQKAKVLPFYTTMLEEYGPQKEILKKIRQTFPEWNVQQEKDTKKSYSVGLFFDFTTTNRTYEQFAVNFLKRYPVDNKIYVFFVQENLLSPEQIAILVKDIPGKVQVFQMRFEYTQGERSIVDSPENKKILQDLMNTLEMKLRDYREV